MSTKTSQEWYISDTSFDIINPKGWKTKEDSGKKQWHTVEISYFDYLYRRGISETVLFGKNEHSSPYGDDYDSDDEEGEGCIIM